MQSPCVERSTQDLEKAADALGRSLVFGCTVAHHLRLLSVNPTAPIEWKDTTGGLPYMMLQSMIIAERWLQEFLLGPGTIRMPDDICVECFKPGWRLAGETLEVDPRRKTLRAELEVRKKTLNKLVLHPTWRLVQEVPRAWTLTRIEKCADALEIFASEIGGTRSTCATRLHQHIRAARHAFSNGDANLFRMVSS